MLKTILILTIMLGLSTIQAAAQEAAITIQRTAPELIEVSTLRQMQTSAKQVNPIKMETSYSSTEQEIKKELVDVEEDMGWHENRKRRPLARLVFLAAVVVLIVVLV